jgi:hypothetical protein
MAWNDRRYKVQETQIDSEQEIWSAIRYLDPDRDLKKRDFSWGIIWILVLLLVCVFIYLLHH